MIALGGAACTKDSLRVVDSTLSDRPAEVKYLGGEREERRAFSADDEQVTLSVRFGRNYVGAYQWFKVEWVRPDGQVYLREGSRTRWGSHQDFNATMPIRGRPAGKFFPGAWKVRLFLDDRLVVEEPFEIRRVPRITAQGIEDPLANANARPILPGCPPPSLPPGDCVDEAPEE